MSLSLPPGFQFPSGLHIGKPERSSWWCSNVVFRVPTSLLQNRAQRKRTGAKRQLLKNGHTIGCYYNVYHLKPWFSHLQCMFVYTYTYTYIQTHTYMSYTRLRNLFDTKCRRKCSGHSNQEKNIFICNVCNRLWMLKSLYFLLLYSSGFFCFVLVFFQRNHFKFVLCLYYRSIVTVKYRWTLGLTQSLAWSYITYKIATLLENLEICQYINIFSGYTLFLFYGKRIICIH